MLSSISWYLERRQYYFSIFQEGISFKSQTSLDLVLFCVLVIDFKISAFFSSLQTLEYKHRLQSTHISAQFAQVPCLYMEPNCPAGLAHVHMSANISVQASGSDTVSDLKSDGLSIWSLIWGKCTTTDVLGWMGVLDVF